MTDELDLVRRFRADEPDAGEDAITARPGGADPGGRRSGGSPRAPRDATTRRAPGACVAPS